MVSNAKTFEAAIRDTVKERRIKMEVLKKRLRPKNNADTLKDLLRAIEEVEKSVKALGKVDLAPVSEIDLADKREIISRLYTFSESLVAFAEQKINSLKVKRYAAAK